MQKLSNVFLVGPMGAGKSSIGRQLAQMLGFDFLDTDHEIENRTGANIPWIFDMEGEEGFRQREEAIIDQLSKEANIVLATGGGGILREQNRARLAERGLVVYLKVSLEQQLKRTAKDKNRPLLQTKDPRAVLEQLIKVRGPLYEEIADIVVDTNSRSVREVAKEIVDCMKSDKR